MTTLSALLSLLLPPLAYLISGSVIGLITLRKGPTSGLQVIVGSLILLMIFSISVGLSQQLALAYALVIWMPVWAAATVLRLTERQGLMLIATGFIGISLIVVIYLVIGDVTAWWQQWLDIMLEKAVPPEQVEQYRDALQPAVSILNAMMVSGLVMNIVMATLAARWRQASLFNPGAFRKEFHALSLPPQILLVGLVIIALAFLQSEPWQFMFRDCMFVLIFLYLIQGISAVHRNVDIYKLSSGWLVSMYCMLILLPQIGMFIACLGVTDVYIRWRRGKVAQLRIVQNQDEDKDEK